MYPLIQNVSDIEMNIGIKTGGEVAVAVTVEVEIDMTVTGTTEVKENVDTEAGAAVQVLTIAGTVGESNMMMSGAVAASPMIGIITDGYFAYIYC